MRHAKLVSLALLADIGSAALFTLSNFESLASLSLPLNCVFAYNTPIRGCELSDFMEEGKCSSRCKQGLQAVEINVMGSCTGITVKPDTLLADAQKGRLVDILCPGSVHEATPSKNPSPVSTTSPLHPTTTRPIAPTKPQSISSGSRTESASSSSRSSTTSVSNTPSESVTVRASDSSSSVASTSTSQQSRTESAPSTTNEEPPRRTFQPGSGGGSPFDMVTSGAARSQAKSCLVGVAITAVAFLTSV